MKSIINVRRSSICWRSEELITDVRKPEIMVMTSFVGGELFTDYSDHPRKLVTLNPKLKSTGAGRHQLLFLLVGCLPQAAWPERLLSEKSGRCGIAAIKERGAVIAIDHGDIRQAIDRCSNIWASLPGLLWSVWASRQPDCKIQRSGRNGQRDWCMSRVTAIISALVICIIVCSGRGAVKSLPW